MPDQIEIHWVWWLVAAVALGVVEVFTLDLVLLMFAVGALAAVLASLLGAGITVQVLVFIGVSLVMLLVLRPYLLRNLRHRTPLVETNTAAHVGRQALTLTEVDDRGGQIKLAGETWSARAHLAGEVLPADVEVQVVRIEGATAVVGPLPPHEPPGPARDLPTTDRPEGPR